ncbi:Uncharacterized protein Fot_16172 [Forsythia ovata]|uniref:Uncharacterized protein n=1 Tax=Forsythia ovata TaxID=205694 RepID=A0ABD1WB95_9LAMI
MKLQLTEQVVPIKPNRPIFSPFSCSSRCVFLFSFPTDSSVTSPTFGTTHNRFEATKQIPLNQLQTSYKHTQPLQPRVQFGKSARKIIEEELKQYYGSESEKPLIMVIKGSDLRCFAKRKLKERSDQYAATGLVRTQESKEKIN